MAYVTMDNPLSPSPQSMQKKVMQDIEECVSGLRRDFEETGYPITDDSQTLHRLCAKLEFLLQVGFKGKSSLFGEKKDYWNYFIDCIGSTKDLRDGIKFVKANTELRTSLGRGRAFLRFALVHQRLADTLQQCVCSTKHTNGWYNSQSVWLQPALSSAIINTLYDLNDLQFDLLPRGYDLDTTWPTFARKTFGSPQTWAPPSRSTSISSLASLTGLPSFPSLPAPPDTPSSPSAHSITQQNEYLNQSLTDSESERFSLQVKLESLMETKEMANNQVEELEKQVKELQKTCNEYQVQNETLKAQCSLKESMWAEKEAIFKAQIEQADQNMTDLRNQIANGSTAGMNIAELMAKLAIQQKRNSTLQIELKTSQLELQAKTQTDNGKTKLIELLDKKIEQLQGQNQRMLVQIENVADERMRDVEGNKTSHSLIEQTMDRLKRADEINGKLQLANEQLRKMLDMMEEKTGKITTMAKEKLILYKTENTKLQLTVQSLTIQLAKLNAQSGEAQNDSKEKSPATSDDNASKAITLALTEAQKNVEMWKNKFEELQDQMEKLKAVGERSKEGDKTSAGSEAPTKLALEKEIAQTNKALVKSREEVKRVLIEKMTIDEESMMVEARGKEVKGRHEELLKQLAFTEAAVRKLEYDITSVNEAVEAAEAQKEGAETPQDDDSPLVLRIKSFIKETMQLKSELQGLDVQNIALQNDIEMKEKVVEELKLEILGSQLQIAELKTLVRKSEVAAANMATKLEEYKVLDISQIEIQDQKEEVLGQSQSEDYKATEFQNELEEQNATINLQMNIAGKDEASKSIIEGLESKYAEYRKRYETLMEEKVILESKCRDLETKLKTTKQNLKKADKDNIKLLSEREHLKKELGDLKNEVEGLTLANESLNVEMMELESTIMKSVEGKLTSLQLNLEREQTGRKKLEFDFEHMRNQHRENEKLLGQLQKKKQTPAIESRRQISTKEDELVSWKRENELLRNKLVAITEQCGESSTREVTEREEFKMDIDLLECDLQKANDDLEVDRANIAGTEQLLINSFKEIFGVDHSMSSEKPSLKALATMMASNLKEIQEQMTEKNYELEEAFSHVESQRKTLKEFESAALTNIAHGGELSAQLDIVTFEMHELKDDLSTAQSRANQLESTLESGKEGFHISKSLWEDEKESLTKNITELMAEVACLSQKISSQQQKLDLRESEFTEVQESHDKLESALEDLRNTSNAGTADLEAQNKLLTNSIAGLNQSVAENVADIVLLKQTLDEKESQLLDAESTRDRLEASISELREASSSCQSEWLAEKEALTNQIVCLTKAAVEKEANMASVKQKLNQQDSALAQAGSTMEELELNLSELRQAYSELESAYKAEKDSLGKEIASLSETITQKLDEIEILNGRLVVRQDEEIKEHNGLQERLDKTEAEMTSLTEKLSKQEMEFCTEKEALQQEVSALQFEISSQKMEHQQALQGLEGRASSIKDLVSKLAAQESLIEMLEKDLELLKRERLLEKNRTLNDLEELRQSLSIRNEECKLLNGELKRTSMLLDEERNLSLRLKNELAEVQGKYDRDLAQSRQEVKLLNTDLDMLKKQLIKIIKDKDELWQKTDKLEYMQRLTVAGSWMEDTDTLQCLGCNATFSFMLRKHHCRVCGRIFCYSCCNQWVKAPNTNKKTRICSDCALYHKSEMEREAELEDAGEHGVSANAKASESKKRQAQASQSEHTGNPDDVRAKVELGDTIEEDKAPSSFRPEEESDDSFLTSSHEELDHSKSSIAGNLQTLPELAGSPAFEVGADTTVDPGGSSTTNPLKASTPSQSSSKSKKNQLETDQNSDYFCVITEEEIVQSLQDAVLETDARTLAMPILTVDQIATGHVPEDPNLCVRAGKIYVVPVFIEAPGIVLCWEFSTEPKGIHFSVTFRRDALTSHDLAEVLIPLCPCNSHRAAVQGELIAVQPGLYTLIFDNSNSRFTPKKLNYQLHVKKPEAAD